MKKLIVFIICLATINMAYGKKLGSLTDVINPYSIMIAGGKLYVVEGPKIYIYSIKNLKLEAKFGNAGEGPSEFKVVPIVNIGNVILDVYPNFLAITSIGKLSYFSTDGKFLKEFRTEHQWGCFKPLGDKFVGRGKIYQGNRKYNTVKLFDSNFKNGEEFSRTQSFFCEGSVNPMLMAGPEYFVINNLVYVEEDKELIQVYDMDGKPTSTLDISKGYDKVKITQKDIDKYLDYFKTEPAFESLYPIIKRDSKFPKYFPPIKNFASADGKLYIIRWTGTMGTREIAEFDVKGNLLKKARIPFFMKDPFIAYAYSFNGGKIYQLVENENDEGKWDLLVEELK